MPSQKKILIVEDEKPIAKAMELKLNNSGYFAKAVFDGMEALKELDKEKYDLLLVDIMMPNMDGFTLLGKLREKNINTPAIVTSNLSQKEDVEKAKNLGARDFFVKSDTPLTEIVRRVEKFI
ncbi:MAG: Transcriptional activator protein Irlr [uncultured bacterium]|nr:MAG: Transcriptional activator protein Irlr [uncultured bacterium]HBR71413.1 hypothetical protein [Candidatus Moranbacteria bacterium]